MMQSLLADPSYLTIVVVLVLTGVGLPLPEEVVYVSAGVLSTAAAGRLDPWPAFLACLAGALIGDVLTYAAGRLLRRGGLGRHRWIARLFSEERERRMERLVARHGLKVLLLGRFLTGLRAPLYLAVGALRVGLRPFLAADLPSALLVVAAFFWSSHLGGAWVVPLLRESQQAIAVVVLAAGTLAVIYWIVLWRFARKRLR